MNPALRGWISQVANPLSGAVLVALGAHAKGSVERAAAPAQWGAMRSIRVSAIGRLAVALEFAGRGPGADMLAGALRDIAVAWRNIAIAAALVRAKDAAARRFYLRCAEFVEYPADGRTLFLPIETLMAGMG